MPREFAPQPSPPITILLVEDRAGLRRVVRALIESDPRFKVAGEAGSPTEAVATAVKLQPQLAIIDLALGGPDNGLDLIKDLKAKLPALPILVLSMHSEEMHAKHSLRNGALGYLMKDRAPEFLHEAMATVLRGKRWISEAMRNHPDILEIP